MPFVIIMEFALAVMGAYLVLTDFVIYPSRRTEKLYRDGMRKSKGNFLDRLCEPIAARLEPYVVMTDYKREKLAHTLQTIGSSQTATQFAASAMAQSVMLAAVGLFLAVLHPLLPIVMVVMAVVAYFKIMSEPEKQLKEKRERIEHELPRFASTISNSLSASRDVVKILENYRRVCGVELADELDITLADMKTGNAQNALRGLESRIGSSKLSELVRGLLSVLRGEDQVLYFYTKNVELRQEYIEYQKREIQERPNKLTPFVIGIVAVYLVMMLYILGYQVVAGSSAIF